MRNVTLIYTDETWVNAHHTNEYIWVDSDRTGGWKMPSGKVQRRVEGGVEEADLVFRSKPNSADYRGKTNSAHSDLQ